MKEIKKYIAMDGKEFETAKACAEYELKESAKMIKEFCESRTCEECPYNLRGMEKDDCKFHGYPINWNI